MAAGTVEGVWAESDGEVSILTGGVAGAGEGAADGDGDGAGADCLAEVSVEGSWTGELVAMDVSQL